MSLALNFEIEILSMHIISYFISFDSPIWTLKSDIIRGSYELYDSRGWSCESLSDFCNNFSFLFMFLTLNFEIMILLRHIIACFFSFDSSIWTLKSDIIRGSYELSNACGSSCPSLLYLWHNFTFSFVSLAHNFTM